MGMSPLEAKLRGRGETVLVIEDDPPTLAAMAKLLTRFNYLVLTAASSEAALRLWESYRTTTDAVLSDFDLRGGPHGVALLQQFAAEKPALISILISAKLPLLAIHELQQTMPLHHVSKPFDPYTLLENLRGHLDQNPRA